MLKMLSTHPIGRLIVGDVPVPSDHVLGEIDGGFRVAMQTLGLFRPSVGAFAIRMATAALDAAVDHASTRVAFGRPMSPASAVAVAEPSPLRVQSGD